MLLKELFGKLPDLILLHEDFAVSPAVTIPEFGPRYAKVIGTSDGREVWGSRFFGPKHDVYAFRTGEELDAFIVIGTRKDPNGYQALSRAWCEPKLRGGGLISSLLGFATKKADVKVKISKNEPLTADGFSWLEKLIKRPYGFTITDSQGNKLDAEALRKEWERARDEGKRGATTVLIENWRSNKDLFATGYRMLGEASQHLGSREID